MLSLHGAACEKAALMAQISGFAVHIIKGGRALATIFKGRWESIDALRGAAALGVVVYHALRQIPAIDSWWAISITAWLRVVTDYGYVSVFLFFVISGFCIHLRWAKATANGQTPQLAFWPFWKQRWWRLYPPYLIALAIYLGMGAWRGDIVYNSFFFYDLAMHLAMLHNLDKATLYSLNSVFWTLAIEEQLYLAYFLLLFLRERFGWTRALMVCLVARAGWQLFGNYWAPQHLGWDVPVNEAALMHWFTWALGALGVEAALGLIKLPVWARSWRTGAALAGLAVTLEYILTQGGWYAAELYQIFWFLTQPVWGLAFFCIVNYFVHAERGWQLRGAIPTYIKGFATVGLFSYSLYLIHEVVLIQAYRFWILRQSWLVITLFVLIPLCVACAWVFFLWAEKPFINKK